MSTKRPPAPERRTGQAIDLFEKGIKAMGRKEYDKAREHFDAIINGHAEERDVAERARAYRTACERAAGEGRRSAYKPKTFEDYLNHGVYLHNRGEYEEAIKALRQASEMQPKSENALYCLAAAAARAGDSAAALKALRAAIGAGAESRAQARRDPDFDVLRDDDEFLNLVYEAS
jgi:tetratricopeptide (TPR) repeat protein